MIESPLPMLAMGAIMVIILISGLFKTGNTALLWGILGVVLLTAGMVVVERVVITTREQIESTLQVIANDLESGDRDRIMSHISINADNLRREAERIWPRAVFHEVKVKRNLRVEQHNERHVTARFNAVLVVSDRNAPGDKHRAPQFFIVEFFREGGDWKVGSYERRDPREGL